MSSKAAPFVVLILLVAACTGSIAGPSPATPSAAATPPSASVPPTSVPVTPAPSSPATTPVPATPSGTATPAPVDPTAATPQAFASPLYGYGITLPADWSVGAAMIHWDGASSPGHDDGSVDKFVSHSTVSMFVFAAPMSRTMNQFLKDNIAWTVRDHGDTCPATKPEETGPVRIGRNDGVLQSWDCGILINNALLIRKGIGYEFVLRDLGVQAATDPADRVLLDDLLGSVTFP